MFCGSCLRDNRVAATLIKQGRDVLLVPLYTPIRTDEQSVATRRVLFGGLNAYLQQHYAFFRKAKPLLDRFLDSPVVLSGLSMFNGSVDPNQLGALTVSVLRGEHGAQAREVEKMIAALRDLKPDLINIPDLFFLGFVRPIKEALNIPVVCTLSGEDLFLDSLRDPYKTEAINLITKHATLVDGFIAVTRYYADHCIARFNLSRDRVHYVPMGIHVEDFAEKTELPAQAGGQGVARSSRSSAVESVINSAPGGMAKRSAAMQIAPENKESVARTNSPFTIGYLARICAAKGLDRLADAFITLRKQGRNCRLRIAGYLNKQDRPYLRDILAKIKRGGVPGDAYDFLGEVDLIEKRKFLHSLDVFSVPAAYPEAKGLSILEAMAAGVPVVQPNQGSYPELIESTGGGQIYDVNEPSALASTLAKIMDNPNLCAQLSTAAQTGIQKNHTDELMAKETWLVFEKFKSQVAK